MESAKKQVEAALGDKKALGQRGKLALKMMENTSIYMGNHGNMEVTWK